MSMSERKAYTGKYGIDSDSHNNYISKHFFFQGTFHAKIVPFKFTKKGMVCWVDVG